MYHVSSPRLPQLSLAFVASIFFAALISSAESPEKKKTEKDADSLSDSVVLSPFTVSTGGTFGATPGGAKDTRFFRSGAARGEIPLPDTLTAEGLFSEHDLPLDLGSTEETLFRVQSAATEARFEVLPEARYLAQIGLDSGVDMESWKPAPLNLIAVIDKSGSMSGQPLALVRLSLKKALSHLRNGDQLSIVLYGDRSHVHLPATVVSRANRSKIIEAIETIESAGSTNMEEGLALGYEVARTTKANFKGNTRVMLFTDERPNVGNTDAGSFMTMAKQASQDGIGLTTIGVGVQFGAELATKISSVRGGNLFFFSSPDEMKKTFAEEFDTLVTELAHDFSIRVEPAEGLRLAGVFGVPGEMLRWDGRAIVLDVATIFLSQRKGGIYFALAPASSDDDLPAARAPLGEKIAEVKFSYRQAVDLKPVTSTVLCRLVRPTEETAGLSRGVALVDEYLTLKRAAQAHHNANDQETAFRLVSGLEHRFAALHDEDLYRERKPIRALRESLALLSGHAGEAKLSPRKGERSGLTGVWRRTNVAANGWVGDADFMIVSPSGTVELLELEPDKQHVVRLSRVVIKDGVPAGARGLLKFLDEDDEVSVRFDIKGDTLSLKSTADDVEEWVATFTRSEFSQMPKISFGTREDSKDETALTGLPRRPVICGNALLLDAELSTGR